MRGGNSLYVCVRRSVFGWQFTVRVGSVSCSGRGYATRGSAQRECRKAARRLLRKNGCDILEWL